MLAMSRALLHLAEPLPARQAAAAVEQVQEGCACLCHSMRRFVRMLYTI